jgi:uncharacterized alkaline shock family protein YloU
MDKVEGVLLIHTKVGHHIRHHIKYNFVASAVKLKREKEKLNIKFYVPNNILDKLVNNLQSLISNLV